MTSLPDRLKEMKFIINKPGTKKPVIKGWTDPKNAVDKKGAELYIKNKYNVAVLLEDNLIVIDVDIKNSIDGANTLKDALGDLKETFSIKTASGGSHYYLYSEIEKMTDLTYKENHVGEIRVKKNQVHIPPSIIDGKSYEIEKDLPILTVSKEELLSKLAPFIESTVKEGKPAIGKSAWQILQAEKPSEQERVSCIMKIYEANKKHDWGVEKIFNYVDVNNKWVNYNADLTKQKIWKEVSKYFDKPNPYEKTEIKYATNKIQLKDLDYFNKLKKDKRFLIESMLYPKTINMLFSPPAQFKSLLANHMALCIATGKPFMGLKAKKYPVIFCDKENNEQILKERLKCLCKGHNHKRRKIKLWFVTQNGDLLSREFLIDLKNHIKENKVKLVIFDTLHRFADYEENKADDINRIYTKVFQPLINECDCSILFLHHTTKEGRYRGSSDLFGMIDTAYSLRRDGKKNTFKLICEKSRFGEIEQLHGEIDFAEEYIKFNVLEEREANEDKMIILKETTDKLREMFPISGTNKLRKDIMTDFEMSEFHPSPKTIDRSLRWLVNNEYLKKGKRGEFVRI